MFLRDVVEVLEHHIHIFDVKPFRISLVDSINDDLWSSFMNLAQPSCTETKSTKMIGFWVSLDREM